MEVVSKVSRKAWKNFLEANPDHSIFQTPLMYDVYKKSDGFLPFTFFAVDDGEIVSSVLAVVRRYVPNTLSFLNRYANKCFASHSPIFLDSQKGVEGAIKTVESFDKKMKNQILFAAFGLDEPVEESLDNYMRMAGYNHNDTFNSLIDLSLPLEKLWQNIRRTGRTKIRSSERKGVVVEEVSDLDGVRAFYNMHIETYNQAGLPVEPFSFFETIFKDLTPFNAKFLLAKYRSKIIAGRLLLVYHGTVHDFYAASLTSFLRLHPNDLLVWHSLKWANENGCRIFDFGGLGEYGQHQGIWDFKSKFGGKVIHQVLYRKIFSPLAYSVSLRLMLPLFLKYQMLSGEVPELNLNGFFLKMHKEADGLNRKNILSLLETDSNARLLDLGCGDGKWTLKVADKVETKLMYGIELDEKAAELAAEKGISVANEDLNNLFPFTDNFFDVVHANQVIEHICNIDHFLSEIFRVLKKEGYAIISTENASSWHNIFASIMGWQIFSLTNISPKKAGIGNPLAPLRKENYSSTLTHKTIMNYQGLIDLLKLYGFHNLTISGSGYYPLKAYFGNIDKKHCHFITIKCFKEHPE